MCIFLKKNNAFQEKNKSVIFRQDGYNIISLLISVVMSSFLLLGVSNYIFAIFKLEYKNFSKIERDLILNEIENLMKDPLSCLKSIRSTYLGPHQTQSDINTIYSWRKDQNGVVQYQSAFETQQTYGGKWILSKLSLTDFKGSKQNDLLSGFIGLTVRLSPFSKSYGVSEVKQVIPLKVKLTKNTLISDRYDFTTCELGQSNTSTQLCDALSGQVSDGKCQNVSLPGGFITDRVVIHSTKISKLSAQHIGEHAGSNPNTFLIIEDNIDLSGITSSIVRVDELLETENVIVNNQWHPKSFPEKVCISKKLTLNGEDFQFVLNNTPQIADSPECQLADSAGCQLTASPECQLASADCKRADSATCTGNGQYIQSIDPKSWTANCGGP